MRGAELILRFLALSFSLNAYEKPLAAFLNKFAQLHRSAPEADAFEQSFKSAVDGIQKLLGNRAFRLIDENDNPHGNFNAAVFDAQMVGFVQSGRSSKQVTVTFRRKFLNDYRALQENREYNRSITASTSDPPLVLARIKMFKELVESTIPV